MKFFNIIKKLFCNHLYNNGIVSPFINEYGQYSIIYKCEKCNKRIVKYF